MFYIAVDRIEGRRLVYMIADLCHFVILFCRCEIAIIFVISEWKTERHKSASFCYVGATSKRRKDAIFHLFVILSFSPEITKRRSLSSFRGEVEKTKFSVFSTSPRQNEITKWHKSTTIGLSVLCRICSHISNCQVVKKPLKPYDRTAKQSQNSGSTLESLLHHLARLTKR